MKSEGRRWLIPLVTLGALLLYRRVGALRHVHGNLRTCSMPSAGVYDAFSSLLFGGFYRKIAGEVAVLRPSGTVLDVGCGPGSLAVRLGEINAALDITGLDVDPEMVDRARSRAGLERASLRGSTSWRET